MRFASPPRRERCGLLPLQRGELEPARTFGKLRTRGPRHLRESKSALRELRLQPEELFRLTPRPPRVPSRRGHRKHLRHRIQVHGKQDLRPREQRFEARGHVRPVRALGQQGVGRDGPRGKHGGIAPVRELRERFAQPPRRLLRRHHHHQVRKVEGAGSRPIPR